MKSRITKVLLTLVLALSVMVSFGFAPSQDAYAAAKKPKVTSVKLNHKVITIKKGKTLKLKATVLPKKAAKKAKLTWSTSKKKVATVKNGKVKAAKKKTGKVKITVKVKGTKKKATCTVYVGTPVKKVVLAKKALTLKTGETASAGAKVSPSKATVKKITYTSSNKAVATVDKKGQIKAVGEGTAVITAKPQDEAGKKAKVKVTVENAEVPVTGVTLDAAEKTIEKGQSFTLTATVAPADATNKAVTFASSDANIATVDADGKVTGVKKGTADITVTTADGGKTAVCKVTVTFPVEMIISKAEELTKEVIDAVKSGEIKTLLIKSADSINIEIPKEDFGNASLVIDAPKGHIENNGKFGSIKINSISGSSMIEHASGNTIDYSAPGGKVEVAEEGSVTAINVVGSTGVGLNLVNNGALGALNINAPSDINISGGSTSTLDVNVSNVTTKIETNQNLNVTSASQNLGLTLNSGAEQTQVALKDSGTLPSVSGLARVDVTKTDGSIATIVAKNDRSQTQTSKLSGEVADIGGDAVASATVYVIPYTEDMTLTQVFAKKGNAKATVTTDASGNYTTGDVPIGNYYVLAAKDNDMAVTTIILKSDAASVQYVPQLRIVPISSTVKGRVVGKLSDAETGQDSVSGLTVELRSGSNNVSGDALETVKTADGGTYAFTGNYPIGVYTVRVYDNRADSGKKYIATSFDAIISTSGDNITNHTITYILEGEQVRFVLTWGNEASGAPSDLDSHLAGPKASGSERFHTYYNDKEYAEYPNDGYMKYADLDVDDTTWVGPETTTIYKASKGTYSFYIHNYSHADDNPSSTLAKSQAVVKVYRGTRLLREFAVPNQPGTLWYVCDYDVTNNKLIPVNTMDYVNYDAHDFIGQDITKAYQDRLKTEISRAEGFIAALTDSDAKATGSALLSEAKKYTASTDRAALVEQYSNLRDWNDEVGSVGSATVSDADRAKIDYTSDGYENGLEILYVYGYEKTMPSVTFVASDESATLSSAASDKEGFLRKLTVKASNGITRVLYVKYERAGSGTRIADREDGGVTAANANGEDQLFDWYITDENTDDEDNYYNVLVLKGYASTSAAVYNNLKIKPRYSGAKVNIGASDKPKYDKKITISYTDDPEGEFTTSYYTTYEQASAFEDLAFSAKDADGNELGCSESSYYVDDTDSSYNVLRVYCPFETDPVITCETKTKTDKTVNVKPETTDKDGFVKKITLTHPSESNSLVYYVEVASADEMTVDAEPEDDTDVYLEGAGKMMILVPEITGSHTFSVVSPYSVYGALYNSDKQLLAENEGDSTGTNFTITENLTAGETYYMWLRESQYDYAEETVLSIGYEGFINVSEGEENAYDILNTFRTEEENQWYYGEEADSDSGEELRLETGTLDELTYDAALEATAQLRAKEAWEQYYVNGKPTHVRLDGSDCFTAYPSGLSSSAENLAWGQTTAYEAIADPDYGWAETYESYEGQGHRRNMLSEEYTHVGIACYTKNGQTCWAMCIGSYN